MERLQGQGCTLLPDTPSAQKKLLSCQQHPSLPAPESEAHLAADLAPYPPPAPSGAPTPSHTQHFALI